VECETSYTPGSVASPVRMMRMAIHLDLTLPPDSSSLPEDAGEQPNSPLLGLAPDEACHAAGCYQRPGGLLHRRFTLTRRAARRAVCSLLRYLSGHPGRTLSAIVLYGARKFLSLSDRTAATIKRSHESASLSEGRPKETRLIFSREHQRVIRICGPIRLQCSLPGREDAVPAQKNGSRRFEHKGGPHGYRRYRTSYADQAKVP